MIDSVNFAGTEVRWAAKLVPIQVFVLPVLSAIGHAAVAPCPVVSSPNRFVPTFRAVLSHCWCSIELAEFHL